MSYNRYPSQAGGSGTGTVTTVSVTTAHGVSGAVTNASTTPAIALTLGAITPSSVVASGAVTAATVSAATVTGDNVVVSDSGTLSIGSTGGAFSSILASPGGMAADVTLVLPATYGSLGDVLLDTDGLGSLGWGPAGISSAAVTNLISVLNGKQIADLVGVSNVALTGIQTLDGAPTSGASIVLLTGQTDPTENGLWAVQDFGAWLRPPGWGGSSNVPGSVVSITEQGGGVSYSNTLWFGTGDGSSTALYQRVSVAPASNTGWGSITNVTPDKAYNANATTVDELADVLGTLIAQLVTQGILRS